VLLSANRGANDATRRGYSRQQTVFLLLLHTNSTFPPKKGTLTCKRLLSTNPWSQNYHKLPLNSTNAKLVVNYRKISTFGFVTLIMWCLLILDVVYLIYTLNDDLQLLCCPWGYQPRIFNSPYVLNFPSIS